MTITLPIPPKLNRLYRIGQGRIYKVNSAKTYRDTVFYEAMSKGYRNPTNDPVSLEIKWYRPMNKGDIDAILKCLLDSLQGVLYFDDSQIYKLSIEKAVDKKNPRVDIRFTKFGAEAVR